MPENFETSESIVEYFIKECVTHTLRYFKNECKRKSFFDVDNLLDMHGFQVGHRFLEVLVRNRKLGQNSLNYPHEAKSSQDMAIDQLEAVKFICKEVWNEIFRKQIDKLQTNHRGVFVLKDNTFRWLAHLSSYDLAASHSWITGLIQFLCGVLRGALFNFGIVASVSADCGSLPCCSFCVRI